MFVLILQLPLSSLVGPKIYTLPTPKEKMSIHIEPPMEILNKKWTNFSSLLIYDTPVLMFCNHLQTSNVATSIVKTNGIITQSD